MSRTMLSLALLLLLNASLLASCGGDDGGSGVDEDECIAACEEGFESCGSYRPNVDSMSFAALGSLSDCVTFCADPEGYGVDQEFGTGGISCPAKYFDFMQCAFDAGECTGAQEDPCAVEYGKWNACAN